MREFFPRLALDQETIGTRVNLDVWRGLEGPAKQIDLPMDATAADIAATSRSELLPAVDAVIVFIVRLAPARLATTAAALRTWIDWLCQNFARGGDYRVCAEFSNCNRE